jgi:CrcB protein
LQATRRYDATSDEKHDDDEFLQHGSDRSQECPRTGGSSREGSVVSRRRSNRQDPQLIDPDLPISKGARSASPFKAGDLALVGGGGALGTLARYACALTWPTTAGGFPTTIFVVNVSGAFAIGLILSALVRIDKLGAPRLFSCVGVLGGWTTMSTAAVGADLLIAHGHAFVGLAYLVLSVLGGALATGGGIAIANRLVREQT